jgi:hypothetical protein
MTAPLILLLLSPTPCFPLTFPQLTTLSRKLLDVVLPVSYADEFYTKLIDSPFELTKMGEFYVIYSLYFS